MKTIVLFRRRPDLTRAAFRDYYENQHVPLAIQHVHFTKYVRNHLLTPADGDFDVMSEFWLADPTAATALAKSPAGAILREDETRFMTVERFRATAQEEVIAGPPRGVETGAVRKYSLMLTRPPSVLRTEFFGFVRNWGLLLFGGNALTRVTVDVVTPLAGETFPADAIVSLWPNERFANSPLAAGTGMLMFESHETSSDRLNAAFA